MCNRVHARHRNRRLCKNNWRWLEMKLSVVQSPVYCIHFNQPNKNNGSFYGVASLRFVRFLSIIIVIVGDIQSSKSTICTFSSFVFILFLCSGSQLLHLFIFNNSYSFDTYNYLCTDYPLAMLLLCKIHCAMWVWMQCTIWMQNANEKKKKRVRRSTAQHSSALKNINIQQCVCKFLWINILCLSFEWDKQKRESRRTRDTKPKNTRHLQLLAPCQRNHSQSLFYSCSESRPQHFIRIRNFRNNGLLSS